MTLQAALYAHLSYERTRWQIPHFVLDIIVAQYVRLVYLAGGNAGTDVAMHIPSMDNHAAVTASPQLHKGLTLWDATHTQHGVHDVAHV